MNDLWPIVEKGGLVAFLTLANFALFRWLQSSQAKLIEVLVQTVDRNTTALHEVRDALPKCHHHTRQPVQAVD